MSEKKLTELEPEWHEMKHENGSCKGLIFDCPSCGNHSIFVPYEGQSPFPSKAMWKKFGSTFEDVSFNPSIDLTSTPRREDETDEEWARRCKFHGFVTLGVVTW